MFPDSYTPVTEADVSFDVRVEEEDCSPVGHFSTDDEEQDKADVAQIIARYNSGYTLAWCRIIVTATDEEGNIGGASLGCCSLAPSEVVEDFARDCDLYIEALSSLNDRRRAARAVKVVRMCETAYRTNASGAGYVVAKHMTTKKRVKVGWEHELDSEENHARAAARVLGRRPEFRTSIDGGGYIMGCDPANDPEESES